jgi:flagellar hook protein FlgE
MFTSFSTALSALNANSTAIDVVGNNLANLNTPGFKASVVYFRDLVTQSLGAGLGETQVGFGTGRPLTVRQFTQGSIQSSTGVLDAAIQGDGFFIVRNAQGNQVYTRSGGFKLDLQGNLLTATGEKVQGWTSLDATGKVNTNGPIGNIVVPVGSVKPAVATTTMSVDLNLNASAAVGSTDGSWQTSVTVYDALGTAHELTLSFTKKDVNTWTYNVSVPGADVGAGTAGTAYSIPSATGDITFDDPTKPGQVKTPAANAPITIAIPGLTDGAPDMTIKWSLYNDAGTGRITQYSQPNASSANAQNGSPAAQVVKVGLGDGGTILAGYSDGSQVMVGQVAMASIRNPDSLVAVGNNNFQLSAKSATPAIGVPDTGGRGSIVGGALESSNVDIATEFTDMIVLQRAYEANSRVITTVDQLSQDTINLVRG